MLLLVQLVFQAVPWNLALYSAFLNSFSPSSITKLLNFEHMSAKCRYQRQHKLQAAVVAAPEVGTVAD